MKAHSENGGRVNPNWRKVQKQREPIEDQKKVSIQSWSKQYLIGLMHSVKMAIWYPDWPSGFMPYGWPNLWSSLPKSFTASQGWCSRFMKRNQLSLKQRTKIAQKLPHKLDEKVLSFQKFIIQRRNFFDFPLSCIGNMDETPMFVDMPGNRTVNKTGEETVPYSCVWIWMDGSGWD